MLKLLNGSGKREFNSDDLPLPDTFEQEVDLPPTTPDEWRYGVVIRFPSGFRARVRPITWEALAESKSIPDDYMQAVAGFIEGDANAAIPTSSFEDRLKFYAFLRVVARQMFIEPVVVESNPVEGQIAATEIEQGDLWYLWHAIGQGIQILRMFRLESTADVLSVAAMQNLPADTEPNSESKTNSG